MNILIHPEVYYMGNNKVITQKKIETPIKVGITGVLISMLLLFPGALFVYKTWIGVESMGWLIRLIIITGTSLSHIIYKKKQKGRGILIHIMISESTYMIVLIMLSIGIPGGNVTFDNLIPVIIVSALGNIIGSLITFNKTYKKKNGRRKGYT